ncbi:hypothetical protein C8R47DRAFT_1159333 [Mycena vitilis]|nr:hypothetical protein C8R47DRAFT_1159333 [Mycena vitilis]
MNTYDHKFMTKFAIILLVLPVVRGDQVCVTSDSGITICHSKLTPATIAVIVTVIVLLLLGVGVAVFLYRRRQFAKAKAAVAANAYVIEASQMQMRGPAEFATTYSASYDPTKPGSAAKSGGVKSAGTKTASPRTAPTTYGVSFPYSSPKGAPPRAQSAISGTYTTMSGKTAPV